MSQASQQAAPPPPQGANTRGEYKLTLDEMTRVMDVARTLRKERSIAERELNRDETVKMLQQKLREAADLAGDPVTNEQIDAAIRQYFENLHEFAAPEPGFQTTLANIYVRRKQIAVWAMALATAALLTWGYWFSGMMPGARRTELRAQQTYAEVVEVAGSIDALATDAAVERQAETALTEASTYLERGETTALEQLRDRLLQQESVLKDEYRLMIVSQGQSGVDTYGPDGQLSGYYLIVEAVDSAGNPVPMRVRNAETNQYETVTKWAEQVPKEVYDQVAADKQADGIVDARQFGVKRRGETDLEVTLAGPNGDQVQRGRQITKW